MKDLKEAKSFIPYKMFFAFVDRTTRVVKYDGLILLRMMIKISKPDTVTNIRDIELGLDVNDVNKCIINISSVASHPHTPLWIRCPTPNPLSFLIQIALASSLLAQLPTSYVTRGISLLDASHLSKYP